MKIDLSPKAVERRLNELNQLWKLCTTLSTARPIVPSTAPNDSIKREMESAAELDVPVEVGVGDNWMNTK